MTVHNTYNPLIAQLDHPPIPTIQQAAKQYRGQLGPLIDLSQAVPGYAPPELLLSALSQSAGNANHQGYAGIEGVSALRDAYAEDVNSSYSTNLTGDQIMITAGCNQAFTIAALTVAGPQDSILLISPWYFNHQTSIAMLGIKTRFCESNKDNGFLPDLNTIESALESDVRAMVIVTPNNPTGAVYPPELINSIYDLCKARNIWLIIDETYKDFLPEGQESSHDLFNTALDHHLISLSSFSKSYCIPGQRLGAVIADTDTIAQMAKVMDNIQICAPLSAQLALAECIPKLKDWRKTNRRIINDRATVLKNIFSDLPDWEIESIGAYFAYVAHSASDKTAEELAAHLAKERGIVTIPGSFFGPNQQSYLRVAFANAEADVLATLSDRLKI